MRERKVTLGWGPRENAPSLILEAFAAYGPDGDHATIVFVEHCGVFDTYAGISATFSIEPTTGHPFTKQVGKIISYLLALSSAPTQSDATFVSLVFVNHRRRHPALPVPPTRREDAADFRTGIEKFWHKLAVSLEGGTNEFEPSEGDWVYLECEAAIH